MKIRHIMPQYELMSKEEIIEFQFRKFKAELQRAWQDSPFYRRKFSAVGLEPGDIRAFDEIINVPVTTKEEIVKDVEEHPPYGSRSSCPTREIVCIVETSGTSGKGKEIHALGAEELSNAIIAEKYGFLFAGGGKGSVVMLCMPITMASAGYWWTLALHELQANYFRIADLSTEEKLSYMKRFGVEILFASPSYLTRLQHTAAKIGIDIKRDISSLKSIMIATEPWSVEWAREIEERWGAKLYEQWGCTQRGFAWTCEYGALVSGKRGMLHFLPHLGLCEAVNRETGRCVSSGEEAELIVTPFGGGGFPLIRFRTNDRAKFLSSDCCPCGRPFDGLECGTISRYDDMMKVKAVNFWPSAVDEVVFQHKEVSEYRGEVSITEDGREEVVVEVEFHLAAVDKESIMAAIAEKLRDKIGIRFKVKEWVGPPLHTIVYQQQTAKTKRWVDKRWERR